MSDKFTREQTAEALRGLLGLAADQFERTGRGAYFVAPGWAGSCLAAHLEELRAPAGDDARDAEIVHWKERAETAERLLRRFGSIQTIEIPSAMERE